MVFAALMGAAIYPAPAFFSACDKAIEDTLQEISRLATKGEHGSQIKCYDVLLLIAIGEMIAYL